MPSSNAPIQNTVSAPAIEAWLVENVARICQLPPSEIGVTTPLLDFGIESLVLFSLAGDLAAWLEEEISPTLLWEYPTIQTLAAHLGEHNAQSVARHALVPIQPHGDLPPLYLPHDVTGTLLHYKSLTDHLGENQPVYGFETPFHNDEAELIPSLEELAALYVAELRAHQPDGPYYLGGYSMGGNLAYEMARELKAQGQEVAFLGLFDTWFPGLQRHSPRKARRIYLYLATALELPRQQKVDYLKRRLMHVRARLLKTTVPRLKPLDEALHALLSSAVCLKLQQVAAHYRAAPYEGSLHFFHARSQWWAVADDATAWRQNATQVEVHVIPGRHETLSHDANMRHLAPKVRQCLQDARANR